MFVDFFPLSKQLQYSHKFGWLKNHSCKQVHVLQNTKNCKTVHQKLQKNKTKPTPYWELNSLSGIYLLLKFRPTIEFAIFSTYCLYFCLYLHSQNMEKAGIINITHLLYVDE